MGNIAIIGGGASGVIAAIAASRAGADVVTLYEKNDRLLKKVLQTGNGRCNLTNVTERGIDAFCAGYNHAAFASGIIRQFDPQKTIEFFRGIGVEVAEINGCVYPVTFQANSVVNALLLELQRRKVNVKTSTSVAKIRRTGGGYEVDGVKYNSVIVAVGSSAGFSQFTDLSVGTEPSVKCRPFEPSLTALKCDKIYTKGLAGIRAVVSAAVTDGKRDYFIDHGELLFKDGYLSGIICFQLSARLFADNIRIDFMPQYSAEELSKRLKERRNLFNGSATAEFFTGLLAKNLALRLIEYSGVTEEAAEKLSERDISTLVAAIKGYTVCGVETDSLLRAQVARGGVLYTELDDKLEHVRCKGLYFAGEAVDIDGLCGGYNLQWAWASGYVAGDNSVKGFGIKN